MKVLMATAMYPTAERPFFGTFVRSQVESLQAIGVEVEPFVLDGSNRKLMYATAVPAIRRRVAAGDIDLVHAHYSYVGAIARTQWRSPVVLTFHGDDLLGTVGPDGRTRPWSRIVSQGGTALARTVDAVIVQNQVMARRLSAVRNVHVLGHEVDFDRFQQRPRDEARAVLGLDPVKSYVLFAASPDIAVKNFPLARAAVASLPDVELLVVHRETQERLALYMNAADALVFTSFQEGSPNVIKQAMACGLPIVSTDVGDVRDVIGGTDGCEVVPGTTEAVTSGLQRVLDRGRRTDGRAAVAHLRPDLVAHQLLGIYDGVLRSRREVTA